MIILEFHHFIELQIICVSSFWLIPIQGTFVTLVTTFHDTLILLIIGFLSVHKYMRNSSGGKGKDWGEISLAWIYFPPLNRNSKCFEGPFPPFLDANYLERTYFRPFSIIILICALYTLCTQFEFTMHNLLPDAFSYVVSTYFLLITWWTFLSSKDCASWFHKS